jgi:hypothetical protein
LSPDYVKSIAQLAQAKGIPAETAQAFIDHQHAQALNHIQQAQAERDAWGKELQADPTIGGAKLQATIQEAARAVDRLFGPQAQAFKDILKNTGYGSNPTIVRALAHAATLLRDDSFTAGRPQTGAMTEDQRLAARYPSMKEGA